MNHSRDNNPVTTRFGIDSDGRATVTPTWHHSQYEMAGLHAKGEIEDWRKQRKARNNKADAADADEAEFGNEFDNEAANEAADEDDPED